MKINYIRETIRRITYCYDTRDPEELMQALGIKLDYLPNDTDINKLKGCYCMINNQKFILIHPDLDDFTRREVCAHELIHGIIHPTTNALFLATYTHVRLATLEIEADTGAAELLLPDEICYKYLGKEYSYIAYKERVPLRYVELKMNNFRKRISKVMKY